MVVEARSAGAGGGGPSGWRVDGFLVESVWFRSNRAMGYAMGAGWDILSGESTGFIRWGKSRERKRVIYGVAGEGE